MSFVNMASNFSNSEASLIFLEVINDVSKIGKMDKAQVERVTVVHEVGHQLAGQHLDRGIMSTPVDKAMEDQKFSDQSINTFRSIKRP